MPQKEPEFQKAVVFETPQMMIDLPIQNNLQRPIQ